LTFPFRRFQNKSSHLQTLDEQNCSKQAIPSWQQCSPGSRTRGLQIRRETNPTSADFDCVQVVSNKSDENSWRGLTFSLRWHDITCPDQVQQRARKVCSTKKNNKYLKFVKGGNSTDQGLHALTCAQI
jgi:hypothetical protein